MRWRYLWLIGGIGLVGYALSNQATSPATSPKVPVAAFPQNVVALCWFQGRPWAAAYGHGLFFWDGARWRRKMGTPSAVTCLAANDKGLWFGTWMEGKIGYIVNEKAAVRTIPLPRLVVPRFVYRNWCLAVEDNSVWVGTQGYLLNYSLKEQDWEMVLPVGDEEHTGDVQALAVAGTKVWIGTDGGLLELRRSANVELTLHVLLPGVEVSSLAREGNVLWIGGSQQGKAVVWQYLLDTGALTQMEGPFRSEIRAILPLEGHIYFAEGSGGFSISKRSKGEQGGVVIYDKRQQRWNRLTEHLKVKDVKCLLARGQELWVGGVEGVQRIRLAEKPQDGMNK